MKKRFRKITAVFLSVVMVTLVLTTGMFSVSAMTQSDFDSRIAAQKSAYPNGSVCYSTQFGQSCFGWAYLMGNNVFGSSPYNWATTYSLSSVKPGDIIQYGNTSGSGHTVFVVGVSGNTIAFADCNGNGNRNSAGQYVDGLCMVKWDNYTTISANSLFGYSFSYIKSAPDAVTPGNNPEGVVDIIEGGAGKIHIRGWAFDRDDFGSQIQIHVYIGGRSGEPNAEAYAITANTQRPDVNSVHGCGDYHGFDAEITTSKRGNQGVFVYALNIGSGNNNPMIGEGTVNITSSSQPQITYLENTIKTKDTFRVCAIVDNPSDVWEVRIATWTQADQSDLKWTYATFNGYITYYADLLRSDFANSQRYINHVYLYDYSGNVCVDSIVVNYTNPTISNVVISQVSTRGMRVSCKVEGETNITRVSFPTWPSVEGNPIWHEADDLGNGYFSTYIFASEHNNPPSMAFHIYAYDAYGSESAWGTGSTQITDEPMEFGSKKYNKNKYIFYNTALSWEDSKTWCENHGGHLVTVTDEIEWLAVKGLLETANGTRCWLGADNKTGTWKWITGEALSYTRWLKNQPDNAGGVEFYLGTHADNNSLINCYSWNDYDTENKAGFICEFDDYYTYGDVNFDGKIDINDVTAIQRHLAGIESFNEDRLIVADTNGDGEVTVADATRLQKYIAKYQVTLG